MIRHTINRDPRPAPSASRRWPIALCILISFLPAAAARTGAGAVAPLNPKLQNLILISIDTLRADHVGAYGYARPTTPAIDRFAADSVLFENCVAHAPTTLASHGSILTSRLPQHHGASIARSSSLASGVTTLAEVLRERGYRTASMNGGIQLDAIWGLDKGFDVYESTHGPEADAATLGHRDTRMRAKTDRALDWLDESERPFFLFLHSYEIHHPYTPTARHLEIFEKEYSGELGNEISVDFLKALRKRKHTLAEGDLEHIIHTYDAELRSVDDAIGSFLAALRDRGLYEETLIVITSDHGEEFGEHGVVGWHAHSLFDELLRVPLIVKYPGSRHAGVVVAAQVRGIDVAPTSLAGLGIDPPAEFAGKNLALNLDGSRSDALPAFSMFDVVEKVPRWSLRTKDWKLVSSRRPYLFNLRLDPGESVNLASRYPKQLDRLRLLGETIMGEYPRAPVTPVVIQDPMTKQLRDLGYVE